MSEGADADSKTEEATEKKIQDTLDEGKTPVSRDISASFGIFGLLGALAFLVPTHSAAFVNSLTLLISNAGSLRLRDDADSLNYLKAVIFEIGSVLAPILILFVFAGLSASFVQSAPRVVFDRILPDFSRISVISGASRLFGLAAVIELVKAIVKIVVIGGAVAIVGSGDRFVYVDAMRMDPASLPNLALKLILHLVSVVALSVGVLAATDLVWTRFKWRRDLRMTRQELKEELKQSEGDPYVKARLRSIAMDRSRRRMMSAVPKASFVVANPTHYAIALRYVREEGGAPMVLAKGKDLVALKIRQIAEENNVPVLERRELARAMYDLVEVDRMIPQDFYRPIAELIHLLESLSARRRNY